MTVSPDQFAEDCREAQESPAKENSFRRYRLNQWTEQDVRWLSLEKWDACAKEPVDLESRECYGGLDLSSTTDLTALAVRLVEGPIEDTRIKPDRPADVPGLDAADLGVVNDAGFDVDATDAAGHLEEADASSARFRQRGGHRLPVNEKGAVRFRSQAPSAGSEG